MRLSRIQNGLNEFLNFMGSNVTKLFLLSILAGFFWFLVELSFVYVLQNFLLSLGLLQLKDVSLPNWLRSQDVSFSVLLIIVFGVSRAAVVTMKNYLAGVTNQVFIKEMRKKTIEYSLQKSELESSSFLLEIFTTRIPQSGEILNHISILLNLITALVFLSMFAFLAAPYELLISLSLLAMVLPVYKKITRMINDEGVKVNSTWQSLHSNFYLDLKNVFMLKIYGQVESEVNKLCLNAADFEKSYRRFYVLNSIKVFLPLSSGIIVIAIVTLMSVHIFHTPAIQLISFFYLFLRIAQSSSDVNTSLGSLNFYKESFSVLKNFIDKLKAQKSPSSKEAFSSRISSLAFKSVSYGYNEKLLFERLNFEVKAGETLLIKGESGKGKSTILHLVAGLLDPKEGALLVNGEVLPRDAAISNHISYVGPEPYLIPGSIRENLIYGNSEDNLLDEDIIKVIDAVGLKELVFSNSSGLEYILNEKAQWSTGQKQRLSIARAILRSREILIFDEATANLDLETERKVIEFLKNIIATRIFIVVSHRDSFDGIATAKLIL